MVGGKYYGRQKNYGRRTILWQTNNQGKRKILGQTKKDGRKKRLWQTKELWEQENNLADKKFMVGGKH
jgi:hypothetical protein